MFELPVHETTVPASGEDFSEDLLSAIIDAGRGHAHDAPTPEATPAIFDTEFEDLVSLVSQNVSVQILANRRDPVLGV